MRRISVPAIICLSIGYKNIPVFRAIATQTPNTVRTGLQSLVKRGWIRIIGSGNRVSTTYRVFLPRERSPLSAPEDPDDPDPPRGSKFDSQNMTSSSKPSEFDPHTQTLKNQKAANQPSEAQNSAVPQMTPNLPNLQNDNKNNGIPDRLSEFDPQNLTPLLSFTNSSLTLHERDTDAQNLTLTSQQLTARELVDQFYSQLGSRVSKTKREQGLKTCTGLLDEGFTPEEIDYAISWLLAHHPETGTFNRIAHFIDQALRYRSKEQETAALEQERHEESRREQLELKRLAAEQARIENIKDKLTVDEHEGLEREAIKRVYAEYGQVSHGHTTLVRLQVDDLIRERYLGD